MSADQLKARIGAALRHEQWYTNLNARHLAACITVKNNLLKELEQKEKNLVVADRAKTERMLDALSVLIPLFDEQIKGELGGAAWREPSELVDMVAALTSAEHRTILELWKGPFAGDMARAIPVGRAV